MTVPLFGWGLGLGDSETHSHFRGIRATERKRIRRGREGARAEREVSSLAEDATSSHVARVLDALGVAPRHYILM